MLVKLIQELVYKLQMVILDNFAAFTVFSCRLVQRYLLEEGIKFR